MTRNLVYMAIVAIVAFTILLIKEYKLFESIIYMARQLYKGPAPPQYENDSIDSDVLAEKQRIQIMPMEEIKESNLIINQMSKYYSSFLAVNQLSVGIDQ